MTLHRRQSMRFIRVICQNETNNGVDDEFLDYSLVAYNRSRSPSRYCKRKCLNLELKKEQLNLCIFVMNMLNDTSRIMILLFNKICRRHRRSMNLSRFYIYKITKCEV